MTRPKTLPLLQHIFHAVLARPWLLAAAVVLVTLIAAWQATKVQVAVNMGGLIGSQTDGAQAMRDYERQFGGFRVEEALFVTTSAPQGFGDPDRLTQLEDLVFELQFAEGVTRVISILGLPAPGRQGAWLMGPELAHLPLPERLQHMRATNPLAAQLVSEDLGAVAIVAAFEDDASAAQITHTLSAVISTASDLSVAPVGLITVQDSIAKELVHDLTVLTPAALLLCVVLASLLFRSVRAVGVIALPPLVGVVWFFGWLGASGTQVDPIMGSLPIVLLVLAFSDSIHVYHAAIHRLAGTGPDQRRGALAQALAETAPAAGLTSITTMIAFASMWLPDSPSLNAMALAGAVGMVLALAAVLILMPLLMWALGVPQPGAQVPSIFSRLNGPAIRLSHHAGRVSLIAIALLAALIVAQSQSQTGFRYVDYLPRGAEVSQSLIEMEARGLGSDRMTLVVQADPDAPLDNVRRAITALWGNARADWAAGPSGEAMLARMASGDGTAHALPVQLPIEARDRRADTALRTMETRLAEEGLADVARFVGPGQALLTEGSRLVSSLRMGLYATILAITLLVLLVYRSAKLAIATLLANLIPILGVEAWLVVTARELSVMNMIALTIAFGIAVDDTLHFLNRFRLARAQNPAERVDEALRHAAPPIVATTVILLAGMLVTLGSALPGIALYGGLIALAVAFALLADLFLLPALIKWSHR